MKPGPKLISEIIIDSIKLNAKPQNLQKVVLDILTSKQVQWDIDPYEKIEQWTPKVKTYLERYRKEALKTGKQPQIDFNSSSHYLIQGACFIEPTDTKKVKEQKKNRRYWSNYYDSLKELSPKKFELLCSKILGLLGVKEPILTEYSADEGIDFYGLLNLSDRDYEQSNPIFPIFESSLEVWLVGQAKHYQKTKVATPDIRELVGATNLGRARAFGSSDINKHPDLKIKACDPVFMLFFTTGEISSYGWRLIEKSGVIAMDGQQVATFLADKRIGIEENDGELNFNSQTFLNWLND